MTEREMARQCSDTQSGQRSPRVPSVPAILSVCLLSLAVSGCGKGPHRAEEVPYVGGSAVFPDLGAACRVVETGGAVVLATPVSTEILESLGNEGYIGAHPNHLNQVRVLYEAKDWVLISFVIGSDAGGGLSGSLVTRACKVRWTKPISSCDDDCTVVVRGNSLRIEEGGRKTLLDLRTGEVLVPSLGINAVLLYVGLMVLCLVIGAAGGGLLAKITIGKVRTRELWVFVGLPVYCYLLTVVVNNSTLQSETPLLGGVAVLVISAVLGFIGGRKGPV